MSELVLTECDKGKSFSILQDDIIVIRLKENPTTGYRWWLQKVDDKVLPLESSDFSLPEDVRIGGGGTHIFTFRAKAAGTAAIQLGCRREWEGNDSILERYDVVIEVGK